MNFPLLSLELRKNRLAAAAVLAAFVVTLPVARLVSSATGMETARALEAVLLVWMMIGTQFAVVLIASSAGAQNASSGARETEAPWPASPARRAAASLGAAAVLAALVSAVLVLTAWAFGALGWLDTTRNPAMNWARPFWMDSSLSPIFFVGLADVLLSSWILSYLIGHGVAGGMAAILLTGATLATTALGMGLQIEHKHWGLSMGPVFAALAAATLALKFAVVAKASAWRERSTRLGVRGAAFLAAALLFGPAGGWTASQFAFNDLRTRLKPADWGGRQSLDSPEYGYDESTPASLAANGRALPVWSGAGALGLAGPDGVRPLLPPRRTGLVDALFNYVHDGADAAVDEHGVLWAVRWDYGMVEIWRENKGTMERVRREPWIHSANIGRHMRSLYLRSWDPGKDETLYVKLEDFARLGAKAPRTSGLNKTLAAASREAGAATPDCAPRGRCLRLAGRTWTFPGARLKPGADALPYVVGGKKFFLTAVSFKDGLWAMIARPDGKVEKAWPLTRDAENNGWYTDFLILPDGTLNSRVPDEGLAWLGVDGKVGRLNWGRLRPEKARGSPRLARLADGRAWLLWSNALQEVSLDGRVLASHPVPPHTDWRALNAGVIVHDEGRMSFVGWDGTVKRLNAPST